MEIFPRWIFIEATTCSQTQKNDFSFPVYVIISLSESVHGCMKLHFQNQFISLVHERIGRRCYCRWHLANVPVNMTWTQAELDQRDKERCKSNSKVHVLYRHWTTEEHRFSHQSWLIKNIFPFFHPSPHYIFPERYRFLGTQHGIKEYRKTMLMWNDSF